MVWDSRYASGRGERRGGSRGGARGGCRGVVGLFVVVVDVGVEGRGPIGFEGEGVGMGITIMGMS